MLSWPVRCGPACSCRRRSRKCRSPSRNNREFGPINAPSALTVSLSRAAAGTVTVDYATRDGTAKAGEDYTFTRGTLSFTAGELEKTVSVPLLDDAVDEGEETFTLKLMNPQGLRSATAWRPAR